MIKVCVMQEKGATAVANGEEVNEHVWCPGDAEREVSESESGEESVKKSRAGDANGKRPDQRGCGTGLVQGNTWRTKWRWKVRQWGARLPWGSFFLLLNLGVWNKAWLCKIEIFLNFVRGKFLISGLEIGLRFENHARRRSTVTPFISVTGMPT